MNAMNKIFRPEKRITIDSDYALWCAEQAARLRGGDFSGLDSENIAEEIESLGRSERREIESRLQVLLLHLLKWSYQPEKRSGSWRGSIAESRRNIGRLLAESPSLKTHPAAVLSEEYAFARFKAAAETGVEEDLFPAECPFSIEQALDPAYLPV
jgi:Domain of unknown function DUF29